MEGATELQPVLLRLELNIGHGRTEKIDVREGDR